MFLFAEEIVNTTPSWRDEPRRRVPTRQIVVRDGVKPWTSGCGLNYTFLSTTVRDQLTPVEPGLFPA